MFSYINSWLFTVFSDLMEWWKNKHILNPFCKKTLTLMCQHNESKFGNWLYPVFRFLFLKYIQISAYLVSVSFAYLTNLKQYDTKHLHNKLEKFVVIFFFALFTCSVKSYSLTSCYSPLGDAVNMGLCCTWTTLAQTPECCLWTSALTEVNIRLSLCQRITNTCATTCYTALLWSLKCLWAALGNEPTSFWK